jgi:FKBP-type peptidyl-prolyl cis-trans isomerase FkpA
VTHQAEGSGASPTATDRVTVHYAGRLADGTEFDSSYARKAPATFPLDGVIPCWTQGVAQMKVGGKATLVCPPDMAYGPSGQGPIPPNATLTFEVELLGIEPPL